MVCPLVRNATGDPTQPDRVPSFGKGDPMPFNVWFPVFTLVLGQALVIAFDWIKTQWERAEAARERERLALTDAQNALDSLIVVTRANVRERRVFDQIPKDERPPRDDDETAAPWSAASERAQSAVFRISDDQTRELAYKAWGEARGTFLTGGFENKSNQLLQASKAHKAATERIGERLRELDRQQPNVLVRAWDWLRQKLGSNKSSNTAPRP